MCMSFDQNFVGITAPVPRRRNIRSPPPSAERKMKDSIGTGSSEFEATAGEIIAKRLEPNYTSPNAVAANRVGNTVGLAT